jgi:hypothetical protein
MDSQFPIVYRLKDPITIADKVYETFELTRKVKVKDTKGLDFSDNSKIMDSTCKLYARLFNAPGTVFDEMSMEDFVGLGNSVGPFLGFSQRTGPE